MHGYSLTPELNTLLPTTPADFHLRQKHRWAHLVLPCPEPYQSILSSAEILDGAALMSAQAHAEDAISANEAQGGSAQILLLQVQEY